MGLDTVELVLETEKHFSISLPDEALEKIETVESYCELIRTHSLLNNNLSTQHLVPNYSTIYQYVVTLLNIEFGVPLHEIYPHSRFIKDLRLD